MALDLQMIKDATPRQKIIGGVFAVIAIIILWQIMGLFKGGSTSTPAMKTPSMTMNANGPGGMNSSIQPVTLKPEQMEAKDQANTPAMDQQSMRQEQIQNQYLSEINEIQLLKLTQTIAETHKAIMSAKLATVTAEKGIVDLLTVKPAPAPAAAQSQITTPPQAVSSNPHPPTLNQEPSYTVLSVAQLQSKWSAVISSNGKLFNVSVGDVLPEDESTVVSIDKMGVLLEKNGETKRVSLITAI